MMNKPNYMDIVSNNWPTLPVSATDPSDYDTLTVPSPSVMPSKAILDNLLNSTASSMMWELIKAERDRRTQDGGSHVGNYWFHSDQASRTQQIALVILGASLPPGIMWKTMSGSFVPMTPTLAQQIFGAAVGLDQAVFAAAENHRQRMIASPTPWSYDFSAGWPLMYDEAKALGQTA